MALLAKRHAGIGRQTAKWRGNALAWRVSGSGIGIKASAWRRRKAEKKKSQNESVAAARHGNKEMA